MKKLFTLILILFLITSACGCARIGSSSTENAEDSKELQRARNVFTEFLSEIANDIRTEDCNIEIYTGDSWFHIENGILDPNNKRDSSPGDMLMQSDHMGEPGHADGYVFYKTILDFDVYVTEEMYETLAE